MEICAKQNYIYNAHSLPSPEPFTVAPLIPLPLDSETFARTLKSAGKWSRSGQKFESPIPFWDLARTLKSDCETILMEYSVLDKIRFRNTQSRIGSYYCYCRSKWGTANNYITQMLFRKVHLYHVLMEQQQNAHGQGGVPNETCTV